MRKVITHLLLFLLFMGAVYSQCPVLCDSCSPGQTTCQACYSSFENNLDSMFTTVGRCPCPDGFYMNKITYLCIFCPVTCQTCISESQCISCIPGYEINNDKKCAKRYSNDGQWLSMEIANDLSQQKLQKLQIQGFYLVNYITSFSVSNSIKSCSGLGQMLFYGLFSFDYKTKIIKSYFGLPQHDWVQIKFQFIAADRWTQTYMILQINDIESYKINLIQGVKSQTKKGYTSTKRHRNFCLSSDPDNLGVINLYLSHNASMLKIRIRTDLSNTTLVDSTSYPNYVYFGLRNVFVRAGTCPTNCKSCKGPLVCLQCISPYITVGGKCQCDILKAQLTQLGRCVPKCTVGYLFTKIQNMTQSKCILCSSLQYKLQYCFACAKVDNAFRCNACFQGYYLNSSGYCFQNCPPNTYSIVNYNTTYSINRLQCISCQINCTQCAFGVCLNCTNGTVYEQGSCVTKCKQDGHYLQTRVNECYQCKQNCAKCLTYDYCTQCTDTENFTIVSRQCVRKCQFFKNCTKYTPCHNTCQECFGGKVNQCNSCSDTTDLIQNYACVASCSQKYFVLDGKSCQKCLFPCKQCRNYLTCVSCQLGYILHLEKCVRKCPLSYFPDTVTKMCKQCLSECIQCYNQSTCISCANSFILFEGKCITEKPCFQRKGYYYDEKIKHCLQCPQNCTSCYKDLCYRCSNDSVIDNGKCTQQCSQQKFQISQIYIDRTTSTNTTQDSRSCKWKDPLCNKYSSTGSSTVCDQCIFMNPMLVLLSSNNNGTKCAFTCPIKTTKVQDNNRVSCKSCPDNCLQCMSDMTCIKCDVKYVLNPLRGLTGTWCLDFCPQGFTSNGYLCIQCNQNCKVCDVTGRCLTCNDNYTLTSYNVCLNDTSCLSNQYKSNGQCKNCQTQCLTCSRPSSCVSCGLLLTIQTYNKARSCVIDCSLGFFKSQIRYTCQRCPVQCVSCISSTQCSVCIQGYYLYLHPIQRFYVKIGTCVRECPSGYYNYNPLYTEREISNCAFCASNCLTCYGPSQDQCLSCYGSFKMVLNSRCVERCPLGNYQDSTGHCDWCHPSCLQCTGPAEFQCTLCKQNNYLYRSVCYNNSCPGSTYSVDYDSRVCQLCQWGCQVCTSPYNCSVCTGGFHLYQGWCYLQCPVNTQPFFDTSNQSYRCGNCSTKWGHCIQCSNSLCQRCDGDYYLYLTNTQTTPCILSCPSNYYAVQTPIKKCISCQSNCITCVSSNWCTKCSSGYNLMNGQCTTSCPPSQYFNIISKSCKGCSQYCINCLSQLQCQSCTSGYYLIASIQNSINNTFCIKQCGNDLFQDQSSGRCIKCSSSCKTCTSFSNCSKCYTNFTLSNGYCYPSNTTNNTTTCNVQYCAKCFVNNICQVCELPYYLFLNTCVAQCPTGFYGQGRTCQKCNSTCTACLNSPNNCSSCTEGLYLFQRRCWRDCPIEYFENSLTKTCSKCPQVCRDCINSTYCKTCRTGNYLYKDMCYNQCPQTTYSEGVTCIDCIVPCLSCERREYCTSCLSPYIKLQNRCVSQCPIGYYFNVNQLQCKKCAYPCSSCKSQYQCTTCVSGFIMSQTGDKCLQYCGSGFYAKNASSNGFQCSSCSPGCQQCFNSTYCYKCLIPYNIFRGKCLQVCPVGTYLQQTTKLCKPCAPYCLLCTSIQTCIQCHNYTILSNGKCISFCPFGTFETIEYVYTQKASSAMCKNCVQPCKQCNGSSLFSCITCVTGYYLLQTLCLTSCPSKYYADSQLNKCIKCKAGCKQCTTKQYCTQCQDTWTLTGNNQCQPPVTCTLPNCQVCQLLNNQQICSKCINPYYLVKNSLLPGNSSIVLNTVNSCVLECTIYTFKSSNFQCLPCPSNCSACYQNQCSQCKTGFYLFKKACIQICPNGYTPNPTLLICQPSRCLYRNSNNLCQKCTSPYLLQKGKCVQKCSQKTYQQDAYCIDCDSKDNKCYNCSSLTICLSCIEGTFSFNNKCVDRCPSGYYLFTDNTTNKKTCMPCSFKLQGCQQCKSSTVCTTCLYPNFLTPSGICALTCPDKYFKSAFKQVCQVCQSNCLQCLNQTACIKCITNTYLLNTICLAECPTGYYKNIASSTCQPCNSKCFSCTSSTNCTSCSTPYYLSTQTITTTSKCVQKCPIGFYQSINSTCIACSSECLTCTFQKCLSCPVPENLFNGKCITPCPDHYYARDGKCPICNPQCKTCNFGQSFCESCHSGFVYVQQTKNCYRNCSVYNQYYDPLTYLCLNCSRDCQSCFGPRYDQCLSCKSPYSLSNNVCVVRCPQGLYRDSSSVCKTCDSQKCLTCSDLSTNCTSCTYPKVLISLNSLGRCDFYCGSGYFYDKENSICKSCSTGCISCADQKTCHACQSSKFLYQDKCVSLCPIGYTAVTTLSQNICKKCPVDCLQCTYDQTIDFISCTKCLTTVYLYNSKCYTTCPVSTYFSGSSCVPCPQNCQTCSSSACLTCKYPFVLHQSQCLKTCPAGYQPINSVCQYKQICTLINYNGSCYSQCPIGTYAQTPTLCSNCPSTCSQCIDFTKCTSCKPGFNTYVNETTATRLCVQTCPPKTYLNNKYCINCPQSCDQCQVVSKGVVCSTCKTGYLHQGKCITTCPNGYYPSTNNTCAQCSSKCLTCDVNGCTVCLNSQYNLPSCDTSNIVCSTSQYVSKTTSTCQNCNPACLLCFGASAGECTSCTNISSVVYYLYESSCLTDCPQGYTKNVPTNMCLLCQIKNCKTCLTSTICTSCSTGYILFINSTTIKCVKACSQLNSLTQNYIQILQNSKQTCLSCVSQVPNCLECYYTTQQSKTICLTCASSFFLMENGYCNASCPNVYYYQVDNKYCYKCGQNCMTCSTSVKCQTCVSGYFLYMGKCSLSCPVGYYLNAGQCTICAGNCKYCISSQCTQCLSPYTLDPSNKCQNCISGYFFQTSSSSCLKCNSNCLQCQITSTKCTKCVQPLFVLNNKCYDQCPTGYYPNTLPAIDECQTCQNLTPDCIICTTLGCQKCKTGFSLYKATDNSDYTCVSTCPAGTYQDTVSIICQKCTQPNCLQCSTSTTCTKCALNFYIFMNSCLSSCPVGYAPSNSVSTGNLQCVPCKTGCKSCPVSVSDCQICFQNLQNDGNGACNVKPSNCTSLQYLNSLGSCSQCPETCLTCSGGLKINCITCRTPQYELQTDKSCKVVCPTEHYYDTSSSLCKLCSTKYGDYCTDCDSQKCYFCTSGNLATDSQSCISSCPVGTYQYNSQCVSCPQHCKKCNSSSYCSECVDTSYILYNNLCYTTCPLMTQAYNNTCRPCDQKCLVCIQYVNNCTSCKSLYKLFGNACLQNCPVGTYSGAIAPSNNKVCLPCTSPCLACQNSSTTCTSCVDNYFLYLDTCVNNCPSGFYANTTGKMCYKCQFPCLTCLNQSTHCLSCSTGYVYNVNHTCSSQCPEGSYLSTDALTSATSCLTCMIVSNCKTCDASKCYKCMANNYAVIINQLITSCTKTCPEYYFIQASTGTCQKCLSNCKTCTNKTNCQKCNSQYVLYNNQCLDLCPQKTYTTGDSSLGKTCVNCSPLCQTCTDNLTCSGCQQNAFLLQGICYDICPSEYYQRRADKSCQPCLISQCAECTSIQCTQCKDNFFGLVDQGTNKIIQCKDQCGQYYFENTLTHKCQKCLASCKVCLDNSTCTQCQPNKSLFINGSSYSCLSQCPNNYFTSITSPLNCILCQQNCKQCTSETQCFECKQNYVLFYNVSNQEYCVESCPQYFYKTATVEGYQYCKSCSPACIKCNLQNSCLVCESTHTLINGACIPHNCINCDNCDETVSPAICLNCTQPYILYKVKCFEQCPVYYFSKTNSSNNVVYCQKCIDLCVNCSDGSTCHQCIPDYLFIKDQGCVNEAVHYYGAAANMSGFTSNITQTMATIYMGTSVGPVAFGQMSSTYFNLQFTQFMLFHPSGGNPQMTQFLNSLQTMSLTNGATTSSNSSAPAQVQARRRLLTSSTFYTESFIQVNASIFFLMFAFLGAYLTIFLFQKFVTQACRVSCNNVWFYMDSICEFMQKRFKWIYFDFVMWLSYIPFLYFAFLQLKGFSFSTGSQSFSSLLAIVIIVTYPLYPFFICHLLKSQYSQISVQPGQQQIKQTLTQMSLSPYLTKVKRPIKNYALPFQQQPLSFSKYFNKANFILIYYPLKYIRKFLFVIIAALVVDPVNIVAILIGMNVLFIAYMIALRPRTMPYMIFDLIIEFVLLAFQVFLFVYLMLDGSKVAMMSIVAHVIGFVTANLSIVTAIVLNLIAYYRIFLCIKDLISHIKQKAAQRQEASNKFQVQKKFLDPTSQQFIDKQIGNLRRLGDHDDTDQDDESYRLSANGRRLIQNLGQKELLLNGIDPLKYVKDLSKKQHFGIEEKQLALKYVNEDDLTGSDDSQIDQDTLQLAKKLQMNEKTLALNKIHPVKYAKQLTKNDAPLEKVYKKFDEKHVDPKIARRINQNGQTDSNDDSMDQDAMNLARSLNLNQKQLAANQINAVKFAKQGTKKDAPLQQQYRKFDQKNVDKRVARMINEDGATDSDDSEVDQEMHELAKKLELNEKQLAFNKINPVKFLRDQTRKDAPLQEQYKKFDEKNVDKILAKKINEQYITDSDDSSIDEQAYDLVKKLNLNEKQLVANQINPLKYLKDQTKMEAPLEQTYKKFDQKNVDRQLKKIINDDGDTDSQDESSDQDKQNGYRLARDLKLNEKQLAANNLNPVKVMQQQAKNDEKLKNIVKQFDQKKMDFKVAKMINDNGQTSSEDSDDSEEMDRIIVARQLKLDEKQLAANNINPMKFAKQSTKVNPLTKKPVIDQAVLSTAVGRKNVKAKKKLLDKQLQQRNQMKRQMSQNSHTDQDEQENVKLSKYNKKKLNNMTEKQMMMEGLDPIRAVKRITKEAIGKKMARKMDSNNRAYNDQIPDFKVAPHQVPGGLIKDVIKSTQQKLKQSAKVMLGKKQSKKDRGQQKIPSEQNFGERNGGKLIDSQSEQQSNRINNLKMVKSHNPALRNKQQKAGPTRKQVQNEWDDQFQGLQNKAKSPVLNKKEQKEKKPKISLVDPNNKFKNFEQEFDDQLYMNSEQSSQAQLNFIKHTNEEDLEAINLDHAKPQIVTQFSPKKIINLDLRNEQKLNKKFSKDGNTKKSNSQLNIKPPKNMRQDQIFNQFGEFEEYEDLGNVVQKQIKQKKHHRKNKNYQDELQQEEIQGVLPKQIKDPKYKRNTHQNNPGKQQDRENGYPEQVTESFVFNDNGKTVSKKGILENKIQSNSERYYKQIVNHNKQNMKLPEKFQNPDEAFQQAEYKQRPQQKIVGQRSRSRVNSENDSDGSQNATNFQKQRSLIKQRLRSLHNGDEEKQHPSNNNESRKSSSRVKVDKQSRKNIEKLKIQNMAQKQDDIQSIEA